MTDHKKGKINVEYIEHMGTDLTVVNSARVSFGKVSNQLEEKDKKLIKYLADHDHMTPFEHSALTVKVSCPLYIRSQIHRHRTFAYNEVSRRYTAEGIEFFEPETYRTQHSSSKQCSAGDADPSLDAKYKARVTLLEIETLKLYDEMIADGITREQARGILPMNLMTEFWMTGNLRNWVHFLKLRLDSHAQPEVQEVAKLILAIIDDKFPVSSKALFTKQ